MSIDEGTWYDVGPHLTCDEAEHLATMLTVGGFSDHAGWLMRGHALGDEPGDAHYIDPEAQCMSCARRMASDTGDYDGDGLFVCFSCQHDILVESMLAKPRFVVAVWGVSRLYGGPEEGGWWYDTGHLQLAVESKDETAAHMLQSAFEHEYKYTGARRSVLGGADWNVEVLDRWEPVDLSERFDEQLALHDHWPLVTPHYE